jgi:hypothetical protein
MSRSISILTLFLCFSSFTSKKNDAVKNFYGIPEILTFDQIDFKLSASYHPNEHYYKQEYIPSGESPDHFNKMLVIDFYLTDAPNKKLAQLKEKELDERKKSDPVVNYEKFENTQLNEYILDFMLSDANGEKIGVVEHNSYHYANYTDKLGHKGNYQHIRFRKFN